MTKKIFYLDVETTGLDAQKNDIIQLAYIVEIDGQVKEEGQIRLQPFNYATIEESALKVNKTTIEELRTYMTPQKAHNQLLRILDKYVDKYNKQDKFIPAGYNVKFDLEMLREFFKKNNHKYFGAYFDYHILDPITFLYLLEYKELITLEKHRLENVCNYFNIEIDAHDALNDIRATRELFYKLLTYLKEK